MAKKVFKLKEIAQEGDYVQLSSIKWYWSDFTSDNGRFCFLLMTTQATADASTNATKYG